MHPAWGPATLSKSTNKPLMSETCPFGRAVPVPSARCILPSLGLAALLLTVPGRAQVIPATSELPVIQKVQLVFSLVSHPLIPETQAPFYDSFGDPLGSDHYAVPYLVCEPLITLYNPHPSALTSLGSVRIRLWDPPVGFRFKKNGVYLREEFAQGLFLGLERFQAESESDTMARKSFTLMLKDNFRGDPARGISRLAPGETRTYSAWTNGDRRPPWRWQNELRATTQTFFDDSPTIPRTNEDGRTRNRWGVEFIEGLDSRAGFQWNHLASTSRTATTLYDFEVAQDWRPGWVAMALDDLITVEARALRTLDPTGPAASEADFRISLLARDEIDPAADIHQDFAFQADSILQVAPDESDGAVASRTYRVGDLMQAENDLTPGGKSTFAVLTAIARQEPIISGAFETVGFKEGEEYYDLRFEAVPGYFSIFAIGQEELSLPRVTRPRILHTRLTAGDRFQMAVITPAGASEWQLLDGPDPDAGLTDSVAPMSIVPVPSALGGGHLDLISIDTTGLGPRHFFALGEPVPASSEE